MDTYTRPTNIREDLDELQQLLNEEGEEPS